MSRSSSADAQNPVASPDASSQEELDAIKNLKGQATMPDNIDVSPAKAQDATDQGLWEPYKPTTWDQIPDGLKSADGSWVAAPRLDNLGCCHSGLLALLAAAAGERTQVLVCNDHEEVGSGSMSGARGSFL